MVNIIQMNKPKIRPYGFEVTRRGLSLNTLSKDKDVLKVIQWLILNIGTVESNKWEFRGYGPSYVTVYFSDKEDAVAFKLRWL